jgi:rhodanese-related sulfurtransferase
MSIKFTARLSAPLLLCLMAANLSAADGTQATAQTAPAQLRLITADELHAQLQASKAPLVFDANTDAVRKAQGIIQSATALSSYDSYDIAKELPHDKNRALVFYCYNEQCMASHIAAERAKSAGFRNVSVMKNGITGWVAAKYPTRMPSAR